MSYFNAENSIQDQNFPNDIGRLDINEIFGNIYKFHFVNFEKPIYGVIRYWVQSDEMQISLKNHKSEKRE